MRSSRRPRLLRSVAALGLVATVGVGLVGCGGSDGDAAKAPTTTTVAGKVRVDVDSDNPSVEYTDKDGNTSEYGEGASLPDGWPTALQPPDSVTLVSSSSATADGQKKLFVTGESTAPYQQLHDGIKSQLQAAGFEITNDIDTPSAAGAFAGIEASSDRFDASISLAEDTDAKKVTILYTLTPTS